MGHQQVFQYLFYLDPNQSMLLNHQHVDRQSFALYTGHKESEHDPLAVIINIIKSIHCYTCDKFYNQRVIKLLLELKKVSEITLWRHSWFYNTMSPLSIISKLILSIPTQYTRDIQNQSRF